MKAALIEAYGEGPRYSDFREPEQRQGFARVRMQAAGIHRLVRSLAAGAHYGSSDELPFVPGVDGVGALENGQRVYFARTPAPFGTLAERALAREGSFVPVPDGLDSATAAAIVNPAMSSWLPLVGRAAMPRGASVLVLGATGTSGRLAVRIALHLGASRVIATGRNRAELASLAEIEGVETVAIDDNFAESLRSATPEGVHTVLDYLWGPVAQTALEALRQRGMSHALRTTTFVQIGSLAGNSISLDAGLLRSSGIVLLGSGAGTIDPHLLLTEIPKILQLATDGGISIDARQVPLADIESEWNSEDRLVVTM